MNPKIYTQSKSTPGYGPRIFVAYADLHIVGLRKMLDDRSMWGGCDKDTGAAKGWEFASESFPGVIAFFRGLGCEVIEITKDNASLVWGD